MLTHGSFGYMAIEMTGFSGCFTVRECHFYAKLNISSAFYSRGQLGKNFAVKPSGK